MGLLKSPLSEAAQKPEKATFRKPRFADVTKREEPHPGHLGSGNFKDIPSDILFRPYSKAELEALPKRYTDEQIRVIQAGEKAIRHEDLKSQGMLRTDAYGLPYLDDLSQHNPLLDKKIVPDSGIDGPIQLMNEDEQRRATVEWAQSLADKSGVDINGWSGPTMLEIMEFMHDPTTYIKGKKCKPVEFTKDGKKYVQDTVMKGKPDNSVVNHALPKNQDKSLRYKKKAATGGDETREQYRKLTGSETQDRSILDVKTLVRHRVVNQTRLGKIASQYVLVIVGNRKGLLGIGEGSATEEDDARKQATTRAVKNMKPIPMYENRTIYGDVYGKVSATEVSLYARPPGFGLRVQHNIFQMARAAGLQDLAARVPRSRNSMNTVKATYQALTRQRIPDEVARGRGKKMVDVRKVYYMGMNA